MLSQLVDRDDGTPCDDQTGQQEALLARAQRSVIDALDLEAAEHADAQARHTRQYVPPRFGRDVIRQGAGSESSHLRLWSPGASVTAAWIGR